MAIRLVTVRGRKVWQARVFYQGLRRSELCEGKREARTREAALRQELREEATRERGEEERPATLRQLLDAYAVDMAARGKGEDSVSRVEYLVRSIEAVTPALLDMSVSTIAEVDLYAYRAARAREGKRVVEVVAGKRVERRVPAKPSTINRDLRTLRAALKKARPEFRFPGGAFFPEDETRVRWLRPEEELLVFETMPSPCREMAKLAALTLMRLTEIRLLRREHVHLAQGVVLLPRAKAGARPVVLGQDAQDLLRRQLASHEHLWVFPSPSGRPFSREHVGRVFRRAARGAGLDDFHFHDLRHHGATMALNSGFTAPIVMALGGWKTERMMRRYAAVTDQTLRAAAEAVAGRGGVFAPRETVAVAARNGNG